MLPQSPGREQGTGVTDRPPRAPASGRACPDYGLWPVCATCGFEPACLWLLRPFSHPSAFVPNVVMDVETENIFS